MNLSPKAEVYAYTHTHTHTHISIDLKHIHRAPRNRALSRQMDFKTHYIFLSQYQKTAFLS
jgi:hypothetical protein